jgi:hypothetical protein
MFSSVNELTVSSILIYHFWLNQSGSNVYFVGAVQYLVMVPGGPLVAKKDADLYLSHSADNNDGDKTTSNANVATNSYCDI